MSTHVVGSSPSRLLAWLGSSPYGPSGPPAMAPSPLASVAPTYAPTALALTPVPPPPLPIAPPPPMAFAPPPMPMAPPPMPMAPVPVLPPPMPAAPLPVGPTPQAIQALQLQLAQIQAQLDAILAGLAPGPVRPAPAPHPARPPQPAKPPRPAPAPAPDKPAPRPPAPRPNFFAKRQAWFISQYGSAKYNSREDVPGIDNANCGPTSLTMVATAFGKIDPTAAQADAAIEKSRRMMGDGNDQRRGTSAEGIARGARGYGLDADIVNNIDLADIKRELAKGRLPIINGNYIRADGSLGGGHFYVVTKIEGDKAYLNDPAIASGPRVVSTSKLMSSIRSHWSHRLISIGPKR